MYQRFLHAYGNGPVSGTYGLDITTNTIVGPWSFSTPFGVISSSQAGASVLVHIESTGDIQASFEVVTYSSLFDQFVLLRFPPGDTH